jgi:hypothetical protein
MTHEPLLNLEAMAFHGTSESMAGLVIRRKRNDLLDELSVQRSIDLFGQMLIKFNLRVKHMYVILFCLPQI